MSGKWDNDTEMDKFRRMGWTMMKCHGCDLILGFRPPGQSAEEVYCEECMKRDFASDT